MSQSKRKRTPIHLTKPHPHDAHSDAQLGSELRSLLKHPKGITALHESSHAVIAALLDTPGFESVDVKTRTRETHPDSGIPRGFMSCGFTKIVWPEKITKGCAHKRLLDAVAPGITAEALRYKDDGIKADLEELVTVGTNLLGVDPNKLLKDTLRLSEELVRDACVFAAIINTALSLLDRTELSANDVRGILKEMQAISAEPVHQLSAEVQSLIDVTELIQNHDQFVAKLCASQCPRGRGIAT